ncbi:synaptotagmin-like protein 2 isoform X4 [Cynoglossus semilaevis]|uniref:synaptotagmin-like protein 2 isoform X4 n=1 Tax=Cynoglossus semilaevis TaxID=244447 RepID=UPI000D62F9F7|nr:synaptotagmin-like protein 2 isoform X4 [Cynoglossus semilaevis]
MIDLSFLSEEEQEAILSVLKRDAELKKSEQQRVQKLQQTVSNKEQLKYLTGEWFYETKQLRHQDSIHGSDIIRASIKHTYKPMTILELSKILPEDSSFVCSENKEVFVPPLLCGLLQEVKGDRSPHVPPPDSPKQVVQSPTKRKNPFNTDFTADNEKQESHGEEDQTQEPREEPLPSFDRSLSHVENLRQDACLASQNAPESNAVSSNSQDSLVELNGSEVRQNNGVALRGILKQWSTSSSMDTSASDLDLDSPTEMWIDKKQVRFNSMVRQSTVERQNGRELGDHSLLDNNANAPPEMENNHLNNCDLENGGSAATGTRNTIPSQSGVGSQEEDGGCQNKARLVQREDGSNNGHGDVSEPSHLELLSPAGSTLTAEHEPGHDDSPTSIVSALRRLSSRMSTSKSLEDLSSQQSEESRRQDSRGQINLSVDDVSSLSPSASFSKQLKTSVSVPVLQDEVDSDSPSETTIECRRNTGSSTSNISLSSGMASMSSVSGSMSSIYPTDYGDIEVQGNIQFAMSYIQKLGEFHIFVVHCQDLAVGDTKKSRTDPYVKCYLLPEKTDLGKKKTTVKKKTFNPEYNEVLRFKVNKEVLKTQNLNVSVWHNDTFGRNSFLGEVELDLSEWDFNNTRINEYMLKSRVSALTPAGSPSRLRNSRGRMRVALRFLPQTSHSKSITRTETGEVQIWVKDCKDLPAARGVVINAFVKCTVLPDTSKKSRQKTRVVKRTANPMFNHTMVYDGFRSEDLREACVEITVWDHDRLNSQFIGGLRLGLGTGKSYGLNAIWMDSTAAEANLWQRMLESDGEWVEDLLPLRMFGIAKCI